MQKFRYNDFRNFQKACNKNGILRIIIVKGVNGTMAYIDLDRHHSQASARELDGWIAGLASGDPEAMAQLYRATSTSVYAYCLSILKDVHDAEDALQDCFVNIYTYAGSYRSQGKPMAWIMTAARNLCLMRLRQRGRTDALEDWKDYLGTNEELTTLDRVVLTQCLTRLTDEERQILVLHAVSGLKHRQIAQLLELNLSTVLSKYHRTIQKLRQYIGKEFE